ncbi:unnamed protein product [Lymnaea stagnalis]|uniref:Uncharacterized protein n=1 Tax=Lymnaea stagnalis TaxID=6523 RepID=A0AAV2GZU2_LYMST
MELQHPRKSHHHSSCQASGEHPNQGLVSRDKIPPGELMVREHGLNGNAEHLIGDQAHVEAAVNDQTDGDYAFDGHLSGDRSLDNGNVSGRLSGYELYRDDPSRSTRCADEDHDESRPTIFYDCIRPEENISCNNTCQGICVIEETNTDIRYLELSMGGLSVFSDQGFNTNSNAMSDRIMKLSQEEAMAADLLTDSEMQSKFDRLKEDRENILSKTNLLLTWNFIQLFFLLATIFYACVCVCNFRQSFTCSEACMWKGVREKSSKKWWSF